MADAEVILYLQDDDSIEEHLSNRAEPEPNKDTKSDTVKETVQLPPGPPTFLQRVWTSLTLTVSQQRVWTSLTDSKPVSPESHASVTHCLNLAAFCVIAFDLAASIASTLLYPILPKSKVLKSNKLQAKSSLVVAYTWWLTDWYWIYDDGRLSEDSIHLRVAYMFDSCVTGLLTGFSLAHQFETPIPCPFYLNVAIAMMMPLIEPSHAPNRQCYMAMILGPPAVLICLAVGFFHPARLVFLLYVLCMSAATAVIMQLVIGQMVHKVFAAAVIVFSKMTIQFLLNYLISQRRQQQTMYRYV